MDKYTKEYAAEQDAADRLAGFRERFYLPKGIYMDGNSLGLMSKDAEESILHVMNEWKTLGINGWLDSSPQWHFYGETLGAMAAELVGADAEEVCMSSSTTVNTHNMAATFYRPQGKRTKILADELNFPSTLYALQSQVRLHGLDPKEHFVMVKSRDGFTLDETDIINAMTDETAMILLPSVLYRSGQLLNMKLLAAEAHKRGIVIGFDCAHSVGSVVHRFDDDDIDFAVWCSYKHLNGGPGSPAFFYINKRHFGKATGLAGWYGYVREQQFDMNLWFNRAPHAGGWQISTPHVLSAAPLIGTLAMHKKAGIENIREKSLALTEYFIDLTDKFLSGSEYGFSIGSPREKEKRGGHVALLHDDAWRICCALKDRGIIPDFRPNNVIRIAPVALYNTFLDVWNLVQALKEIIENKEYEKFSAQRSLVS